MPFECHRRVLIISQDDVERMKPSGVSDTKEQKGAFSGDGTLSGPAWAWTSWASNTTLGGGGGTLRARSQITERGMAVDKALVAPNGAIRVTFTEDYAAIDGATYELLRAKLLPGGGPPMTTLLIALLATAQAPAAPAARVDYYLTEVRIQSADGKVLRRDGRAGQA